jgi:zinc transporter ZupT
MNHTTGIIIAGAGILACILLTFVAPPVLPFFIGFILGGVILYAVLMAFPAGYDEEE